MVPSGPPTPVGGAQQVPSTLLRSNSSLLGGSQPNSINNQQAFSSLVSPRTQFNSNNGSSNNMGLLGNISNVSSLLNHSQSVGNGVNLQQLGSPQTDPLAFASSAAGPSVSDHSQHQHQHQQLDAVQNFQQFSVPQQQQQFSVPQQQQQFRGGLGNVKMEMGPGDQNGQLQSLRSIKMEPQQLQSVRSMGQVKMENQQHSDSSALFMQQQQQQQLMQLSRQSPQAAAQLNLLQQQRMLQFQQHQQQQQQHQHQHQQQQHQQQQQQQHQQQQQQQQHQHQHQQQLIKSLPQRSQLQQQLQQSLPLRPQLKPNGYEPGICARRLTQYMYHQQHRPDDNNIEFWRKFVAEYFAPTAKKRWCVSRYGSGRQTTGVFPQDVWHCEICNRKPGRGFETTAEVLPRLSQIKYASGTMEELLYVDMPRESHNALGQIVLDYAKAIQESVFEQLRVVRDGHLRIVFNPDLKISSWEFCARGHEELVPRRVIVPQVSQLGAVVQKYQNAAQSAPAGLSTQELQSSCNSFVSSARQLAKALEVPLVNDLGYTKRYVRCLQISEVVNSMKDLIDYSRETGTGPMDSLINFPRRTSGSLAIRSQQHTQQSEEQHQNIAQNSQNPSHATVMQLASANGVASVNNVNGPSSASPTTTTIAGLLQHQNSMNGRQESQMGSVNGPYGGGNAGQGPSTSSSNSLQLSQPNPSSPFTSPTPSTPNNNTIQTSHNTTTMLNIATSPAIMPNMQRQQMTQSHEPEPADSQSSVQQILQEMMHSQMNGVGTLGNEMKGMNGIGPAMNGSGLPNNSGVGGGLGYGNMGGIGPSATVSGLRAAMANSAMAMNGRIGMNHISQDPNTMNQQQQQQDMGNRLMGGGLGSMNNFSNLHFDWKPSP